MFSKPKFGCSTLQAKTQVGITNPKETTLQWCVNYSSNIPVEILESIIQLYKTNRTQICQFDLEENGIGSMILKKGLIEFVNTSQSRPVVHRIYGDKEVKDVYNNIVNKISDEIDAWARYYCNIETIEEIKNNKEVIMNLLNESKKLLN